MIRRSLLVAGVAAILSLLIHGLGLSLTTGAAQAPSAGQEVPETTDLGGTFEDFAEPLEEPQAPEVTAPDPVPEEATSEALVASDNPQDVTAPDTGTAEVIQPDEAEEAETEGGLAADEAPAGGPDDTVADTGASEVTSADVVEPAGTPEGDPDPIEADSAPEVVTSDPTPTEPDVSEPLEAQEPQITVISEPDEPEILAAEEDDPVAAAAVTRSLRPPSQRPTAEALGVPERTQQRSAQRGSSSGAVESPLTAYRRSGVDLLALGRIEKRAGAGGFSGSRGPGNASTTNYVGRVLVQLNRSPKLDPSVKGTARVSFEINPDGSLAWVRVLTAQGSSGIERAARDQVRSAAPFPRPPTGASQRLVFVYQSR